jgi:hypothetical protein
MHNNTTKKEKNESARYKLKEIVSRETLCG